MPSSRVTGVLNAIAQQVPAQRERIEDLEALIEVKRGAGADVVQDRMELAKAKTELAQWISTLQAQGIAVP